MTERYECPACGEKNTMWPVYVGRKRFYRCSECDTNYSSRKLDKIWGANPAPIVTALGC